MADAWFKKLGFGKNPFSIKPAAFSYELFGVNVDSVLSGIEDGNVLFVEAPLGYGKTTLLKSIVHRFGGRKKVVYASILPSEKIDVKDLLKRSSIANYITGNLPKGMILVADEAQNILPESSAEIAEFYKSGNIRAVVFFGTRYSQGSFVDEIKAMMNGNIVRLSRPTPEQAISIVRGRIGNLPLLPNEVILSAYVRANGSPRRLLQICEDLCRAAVGKGRLSVSEHELAGLASVKTATATAAAAEVAEVAASVAGLAGLAGLAGPAGPAGPARAVAIKKPKAKIVKLVKLTSASKAAGSAQAKKPSSSSNKRQQEKVKRQAKQQKRSKQLRQSKQPRQSKQRLQSSSSSATVKYTAAAAPADTVEGTEGSYWGEFMGMQK